MHFHMFKACNCIVKVAPLWRLGNLSKKKEKYYL